MSPFRRHSVANKARLVVPAAVLPAAVLRAAVLLAAGLSAAGCSLLYDLEADQCSTTSDCLQLGDEFKNTTCVEQTCVPAGDGDGATGGSPPVEPECTTNGECIDDNFKSPYICRDGECVALTLPGECPIILGAGNDYENLRKPDPIIFGAYSYVDPISPRQSVPTLNYELAIDELNEQTRGGLQGGRNGTLRPFIAVICAATNNPDLEASSAHLIETLKVPAIISSLFSKDLLETFSGLGLKNDVFFLSPLEADSTLTGTADTGLLWHMLTSALDLSPAYIPLVSQTEAYVRAAHEFDPSDQVRVAMVDAKTPFLTDIANYVVREVTFNGKSVVSNEADGNFLRVRTDSSIEVTSADTSAALSALQEFRPHVILGVSSGEFTGLLTNLEVSWEAAWGPKPFYLLSPYLFGNSGLLDGIVADTWNRTLGVNFAAAEDTELYDLYLSKLKSTYDVPFNLEGSENFYDAAYFLMYAIAGAGEPPRLTGKEVALGMTRLLGGAIEFEVGESDVNDMIGYLRGSSSSKLTLKGTMGPPDFSSSTGARRGLPSIYCLNGPDSFTQNAMTYDPQTMSLVGSPNCVQGFVP